MAGKTERIPQDHLADRLEGLLGDSPRKITLSRPRGDGARRAEGRIFQSKQGDMLQLEWQYADGKVRHQNMPVAESIELLCQMLQEEFQQINVFAGGRSVECKAIRGGQYLWTQSGDAAGKAVSPADGHNRKKSVPFPEGTPEPFLIRLGIMDEQGKVYHKAYDKFRQINRFVQFLQPILEKLPSGKPLKAYDLCCGKGYLTFAAYAFLQRSGLNIAMTGVDLKEDVLMECNAIASDLGYASLSFQAGDIGNLPPTQADMVLSLHACDTATDIALCQAVRWGARAILSSPCCHKDMAKQLKPDPFPMMLGYPILRQRYAEMLTDVSRAEVLKLYGYQVSIAEFIPTEHTPKNLLIQAIRTGSGQGDEPALQQMLEEHGVRSTLLDMLRDQ